MESVALEDSLIAWAKPPGETEQTKCDNAVRLIRKAIDASPKLSTKNIRVFAQGSYCNRTNVRQDSDVDVCVLCTDTFFYDLPDGMLAPQFGLNLPATYQYSEYKKDVETALMSYFDYQGVTHGKKAFDIHANTYRVEADAVPAFEYRFYLQDGSHRTGTAFVPDGSATKVFNYPEQNYTNGVAKNTATGGRFKDVVRILKRLKSKMKDDGVSAVDSAPSFLIESTVWNVPNDCFRHNTYSADVRAALAYLFNNTMKAEDSAAWTEVNGFKYLFHALQPWTLQGVHSFASAAWDYLEFK
jgi:hypothetical protein